MARPNFKRLSSRTVDTAKPGKYADGGGLYLIVAEGGSRKWVFRFMREGKAREMGLGAASGGTLADARNKAAEAQRLIADGRDPLSERAKQNETPTFEKMAEYVIASLEQGFRNEKHRKQWRSTLQAYADPLMPMKVDIIDTDDVLKVLRPIWSTKPETASRVRGRIEKILDAARARGYRRAENPARWRGHLDHLLPKQAKLSRGHHAAMPYSNVPAFVGQLRARRAVAAFALEFCILTAARTGEVLGARWEEIDITGHVWTVPGARMKAGREHRVPLSSRALAILSSMAAARTGDFIFPGQKKGKPLSGMAMEMMLRRMKIENATVHGFRSSFRDWAGNETNFPRELAEQALAHVIGDKAEQAYRRGDALERRRALMDAWADFASPIHKF